MSGFILGVMVCAIVRWIIDTRAQHKADRELLAREIEKHEAEMKARAPNISMMM